MFILKSIIAVAVSPSSFESKHKNVLFKSVKTQNYNFLNYLVLQEFFLLLLNSNIQKEFHVTAYSQDGLFPIKEFLDAATFSPEVIVPFQNSFPVECSLFQSTDVSFSCYNFTLNSLKRDNIYTKDKFQHIYVLSTVDTLKILHVLITVGELSGFTSAQYKWLARVVQEQKSPGLMNFAEIIKNTSFRSVNPLAINLNSIEESEKMNFKGGIKIFNLDTVIPQTQIQLVDSIFKCQHSPNNFLSKSALRVFGVDDFTNTYDYDTKMGNDSKNRATFVSGFAVEVLRALQYILNFSIEAVRTNEWGHRESESNEWIGMVAGAINGELDLAISSTVESDSRQEVVDFNMHTHINKLTAFFKRYSGYPTNPLLLPFQDLLWFTILLWICFCRIIYNFFQYCATYCINDENGSSFEDGNLFPWIVAPITFRGVPRPPKLTSLRALYLGELAVTFIINSAFSGTLIAYLSIESNPIQTVESLLKADYNYNVEILNYQTTIDDFKESSDPLAKSIYQKSQQYKRPNKATENPFKAIVRGKLAYIIHDLGGFGDMNRYLNPLEACTIQRIPLSGHAYVLKQGSFVRKGSQLKRIIDHGLLKMMETGITYLFRKRYLPQGPNCDHPAEFSGADIYDLQLAFFVLIVSYSAAIMICILENLWFSYIKKGITGKSSNHAS